MRYLLPLTAVALVLMAFLSSVEGSDGGMDQSKTNQNAREGSLRGLKPASKVVICHRTATSLQTIEVSENAVEAHRSHGDFINTSCEELSCAEICNHQPCKTDFVEDQQGRCQCVLPENVADTLCGIDATCDVATDSCKCPNEVDYTFDANGDCVYAPPTFEIMIEGYQRQDLLNAVQACENSDATRCVITYKCDVRWAGILINEPTVVNPSKPVHIQREASYAGFCRLFDLRSELDLSNLEISGFGIFPADNSNRGGVVTANLGSRLRLMNCRIWGNSAKLGAALYLRQARELTMVNTLVDENEGPDHAVYVLRASVSENVPPPIVQVTNSQFVNNSNSLWAMGVSAGYVTVEDSLFAENQRGFFCGNCLSISLVRSNVLDNAFEGISFNGAQDIDGSASTTAHFSVQDTNVVNNGATAFGAWGLNILTIQSSLFKDSPGTPSTGMVTINVATTSILDSHFVFSESMPQSNGLYAGVNNPMLTVQNCVFERATMLFNNPDLQVHLNNVSVNYESDNCEAAIEIYQSICPSGVSCIQPQVTISNSAFVAAGTGAEDPCFFLTQDRNSDGGNPPCADTLTTLNGAPFDGVAPLDSWTCPSTCLDSGPGYVSALNLCSS